jgi:hypothetical protein
MSGEWTMSVNAKPCPCGSGLSFEDCHGKDSDAEPAHPQTVEMKIPFGGVPGQAQNYIVTVTGSHPKGAPGKYRVVFTLSRDGHLPTPRTTVPFEPDLPGDSHVVLPAGPDAERGGSKFVSLRVAALTPSGRFEFVGVANEAGRLARLESEPLDADGFHDAARKAMDGLSGFLSTWSCLLDLPIWVSRTHVTELSTDAMQVDWTAPFQETELFVAPAATVQAEFKAYAGLYREALISSSPAYEFLCLYKIMEAIRNRRARLADEAKARGTTPPARRIEELPSTPGAFDGWLRTIFHPRRPWDQMAYDSFFPPEVRGWRFGRVKERVEPIRDAIAHALTDGSELPLSPDELLHKHEVQKWLPVLKCIVRRMLRNDFPADFLPWVSDEP